MFCGALLGTFVAVYLRTLPYPLVFDDLANVLENRSIRYLWHPRIFFESEYSRGRPLASLTFALAYCIKGLSLSWLRAPSLALHLGSAILVALLYRRWFSCEWGALLAGGLFLLHPLAADSVIYLSARGSLLALFFLLLALYCHSSERLNHWHWLGFLASSLAAFLSRESAVAVVPLLLLLHHAYRRRALDLWPFLLPILLGGLVLFWLKASFLSSAWRGFFRIQGELDLHSPFEYLRLSISLWPRLLLLFFRPGLQSLDHQISLPLSWFSPSVIAGAAIWAAFGAVALRFFRTRALRLIPILWLASALFPTNSIFPLLDPFSERHFYLALPALAWGFALLISVRPALAPTALLALCILGSTATLSRALIWESPATLWLDAQAKAPAKFRTAYNSALSLLTERDDKQGALKILAETLHKLPPGALPFEEQERGLQSMAGVLEAYARESGKGLEQLLSELFPSGGYWRELLWLRTLKSDRWAASWEESLSRVENLPLDPRTRDEHWTRNTFLLLRAARLQQLGEQEQALALFESVFQQFPQSHFPYWTEREAVGDLYLAKGKEAEALQQFELAAIQYKVFKRFPYELQKKLYAIYFRRSDFGRAADAIGELIRVFPDDPALRRLYAGLLERNLSKHASRQSKEADFYARNLVGPADPQELLKP